MNIYLFSKKKKKKRNINNMKSQKEFVLLTVNDMLSWIF